MEISEGVIRRGRMDLHNSSVDTKPEFNNQINTWIQDDNIIESNFSVTFNNNDTNNNNNNNNNMEIEISKSLEIATKFDTKTLCTFFSASKSIKTLQLINKIKA